MPKHPTSLIALILMTSILQAADLQLELEPAVSEKEAQLLANIEQKRHTDPTGALQDLQVALTARSSAAIPFAIGAIHTSQQNWPQAETALKLALEYLPTFRRARLQLANVLQQQKKYTQAVRTYIQQINQSDPEPHTLWTAVGNLWIQAGKPASADTAYQQALLLDPHYTPAKHGRIQALLNQNLHQAAQHLIRQEINLNPKDIRFWNLLVNTQLALKDKVAARRTLECIRRLNIATPENQQLYNLLNQK